MKVVFHEYNLYYSFEVLFIEGIIVSKIIRI